MIKRKIKSLVSLEKIRNGLKRKNKTVVFTNGCFDLLHYGHTRYLEQARTKGDILIVAVNSDKSVKKLKGPSRPILSQTERAGLIASLESVDYVVIFDALTPASVIKRLKPDILVKGADWKKKDIVGAKFIKTQGGKVSRIKLVGKYSSTQLIRKIVKNNTKP